MPAITDFCWHRTATRTDCCFACSCRPSAALPAACPIRPLLLCLQRSSDHCCSCLQHDLTPRCLACSITTDFYCSCLQYYHRLLLLCLQHSTDYCCFRLQHNDNC